MADAVVDRLEVVEVEDDEREPPPVAVGAGDLARQRLVEVAPVVESGEGVEVGQLASLAKAPCVLDRRPCALRELLELPDLVLGEVVLRRAAVHREEADRAGLPRHRHGQARADQLSGLDRGWVLVDERDRARLASVGRPGDDLAMSFLVREPQRGDDRLFPVTAGDRDERGVDTGDRAGRLERPREHLVQVDRARELRQVAAPATLLLRPLERLGELSDHRLHAAVHLGDERKQLVLPGAPGTAREREDHEGDQQDRHNGRPRR